MGAFIPALTGAEIAGVGTVYIIAQQKELAEQQFLKAGVQGLSATPYRPAPWSKPALYMITVPPAYVSRPPAALTPVVPGGQSSEEANQAGSRGVFTMGVAVKQPPPNASPQYYIFDAILRAGHSQPARATRHPIQVGANIADHILLEQPRLSLDVFMTDVLPAHTDGQWVGNASKSISCFQILDTLRAQRVPLTISTRLKTYSNMYIENIVPDETGETQYAFKARIDFEGLFIATIAEQAFSARPQTTGSTALGQQLPAPVSPGVVAQNGLPSAQTGIPSADDLQQEFGTTTGAGNWSSNSTGQLVQDLKE